MTDQSFEKDSTVSYKVSSAGWLCVKQRNGGEWIPVVKLTNAQIGELVSVLETLGGERIND